MLDLQSATFEPQGNLQQHAETEMFKIRSKHFARRAKMTKACSERLVLRLNGRTETQRSGFESVSDLELSVLILGAVIVRLDYIHCSKSRPKECGALECDLI